MTSINNPEFKTLQENYETEAKEKWGNTTAYKEFESKTANNVVGWNANVAKKII